MAGFVLMCIVALLELSDRVRFAASADMDTQSIIETIRKKLQIPSVCDTTFAGVSLSPTRIIRDMYVRENAITQIKNPAAPGSFPEVLRTQASSMEPVFVQQMNIQYRQQDITTLAGITYVVARLVVALVQRDNLLGSKITTPNKEGIPVRFVIDNNWHIRSCSFGDVFPQSQTKNTRTCTYALGNAQTQNYPIVINCYDFTDSAITPFYFSSMEGVAGFKGRQVPRYTAIAGMGQFRFDPDSMKLTDAAGLAGNKTSCENGETLSNICNFCENNPKICP